MQAIGLICFVSNVLALVPGTNPLSFRGHPLAETSVSQAGTTLYADPDSTLPGGAQFLYDKNVEDSKNVELASVFLNSDEGHVATLQTGFDTISQECSCYYINAKDIHTRFPDLPSGDDYFISVEGSGYDVHSGTFSLVF